MVADEGVALQVIDIDGRLQEEEVEGLKLIDHAQGRARVIPSVGDIDHKCHFAAHGVAAFGHYAGDMIVVLLQGVVRVRTVDADLQLGRFETEVARLQAAWLLASRGIPAGYRRWAAAKRRA